MDFSSFHFRPVGLLDAPTVAAHRFSEAWGDDERLAKLRLSYVDWLQDLIPRGRYIGWLAQRGEHVVSGAGSVLLDWGATWVDPNSIKARLANVFTAMEARRFGLAREVVSRTLESLRERRVQSVSLASTETGQSLYTSLGFTSRSGEFGISLT